MKNALALLMLIVVWSTTPLGLAWSTLAFTPELAGALRMGVGALIAYLILKACGLRLPNDQAALIAYATGAIGVFGGMYLSYLSVQHISSGLLSVIFGLSPMLSAFLGAKFLGEQRLNPLQWLNLSGVVFGLFLIYRAQENAEHISLLGLVLAFLAVNLFVLSVIVGKKTQMHLQPLQTLTGTLVVSTLCFTVLWIAQGAPLPDASHADLMTSVWASLYLAVVASVLSFLAFFYLVRAVNSTVIALPTVITPIIALGLGNWLNNEQLPLMAIIGALVVIMALVSFVLLRQRALAKAKQAMA